MSQPILSPIGVSVADPREGRGGPGPPPLFLDQIEARRAKKYIFFGDRPRPPLSEGLDPPVSFPLVGDKELVKLGITTLIMMIRIFTLLFQSINQIFIMLGYIKGNVRGYRYRGRSLHKI